MLDVEDEMVIFPCWWGKRERGCFLGELTTAAESLHGDSRPSTRRPVPCQHHRRVNACEALDTTIERTEQASRKDETDETG
jgi:hypothetical protein